MKLKELLEVVDEGDLDFYDISTGEDDQNPNAHISGKKVLTYKKTCEKLLECTVQDPIKRGQGPRHSLPVSGISLYIFLSNIII